MLTQKPLQHSLLAVPQVSPSGRHIGVVDVEVVLVEVVLVLVEVEVVGVVVEVLVVLVVVVGVVVVLVVVVVVVVPQYGLLRQLPLVSHGWFLR